MNKYFGIVGFIKTVEKDPVTHPGVWTEEVIERCYYGDVIKDNRSWNKSENLNDDVDIRNSISIVADSFACNNMYAMKYLKWMNAYWKITNIEVQYPRLILSIGGVYNGKLLSEN